MSAFTHTWLSSLFGDAAIENILSAEAEMHRMVLIEGGYARALGSVGVVDKTCSEKAAAGILGAELDYDRIRKATARDGLPVPELVRQLKAQISPEFHAAVHNGMTSQDIVDTSFALALREIAGIFRRRIETLDLALEALDRLHGSKPLMGRTRMQAALPVTVSDRIATWRLPLAKHLAALDAVEDQVSVLSIGGPVGTFGSRDASEAAVAERLAQVLTLALPAKAPHAMRSHIGTLGNWLSLVSGTLGKMGMDIALMAQQGLEDVAMDGGGGSSAMPHKQNPVLAELLVTLARYNATQVGGLHQALVHEQERSGAAWALEWMILPDMVRTTGCGLLKAIELASTISRMGTPE